MREMPDILFALTEWVHEGRCNVRDLEFYESFNDQYRPSHWTRNEASDDSLGTFAQDGAGGQYALWFDVPDGTQPVVKLGDDGDLRVLAVDTLDFAWLLACGVEPIAIHEADDTVEGEPTPAMQDWVRAQSPGRAFESPAAVLARASSAHPGFAAAVLAQVKRDDETG